MVNYRVAVLGGGNGGHCMAADLKLRGFSVNLYEHPRFAERFEPVLKNGTIKIKGLMNGVAKLDKVTTDMKEAIDAVDVINIVVPASGHELFFGELIPHLQEGQIVVVWAGDFGSLRLTHLLKQNNFNKKIYLAETNTLPYGTRLVTVGEVELLLTAPNISIASIPAKDTNYVLNTLTPLFPMLKVTDNVIIANLNNPNPIIHPAGSLLNTGRIQYSQGNFYMYREGITEAVARVIKASYLETDALAKALGFEVLQYEERDFTTKTSVMGVAFVAPFDTIGVIGDIQGPKSIYDRYITEDLPFGLVPMSELGKKLGVATPIIDSIVTIGSHVCKENFWQTGRTLEVLGLQDMTKEEILKYVG